MGNVAEVKSRGATVVLVANDGDEETARQADAVLWVPETQPAVRPVVDVVPLQLFAYHMARLHGHDVDRPRNLAKMVTVGVTAPTGSRPRGPRRICRDWPVGAAWASTPSTWPGSAGSWPAARPRGRPAVHRGRAGLRPAGGRIRARAWPPASRPRRRCMKALGVGMGAAAFRDVEVVRAGLGAPAPGPVGAAAALGRRPGVVAVARVAHPHRHRGRGHRGRRGWPPSRRRRTGPTVGRRQPTSRADAAGPHRRRDERRRRRGAGVDPARRRWWTGPARPWPVAPCDMLGGAYGRRVVVVAGKGNNGADGRVAAASCSGGGGPGSRWSTPATADDRRPGCDLVIDAAYGTGFRGEYRGPGRARRGPRCWPSTSPRGWHGDTGEASRRPRAPPTAP